METLWFFLEDPESSFHARIFAQAMPALVLFTIAITLVQAMDPPPLSGVPAAVLETSFDLVFGMEFVLRLVACPNKSLFMRSPFNLIDCVAATPLILRAWCGWVITDGAVEEGSRLEAGPTVLLCIVPVLRLLKTLRRFQKFRLLLKAFEQAFEALPILIFTMLVITLFFSTAFFLVEPQDNIRSISHAMWLTIVTITTVGYGDTTPSTTLGHMLAAGLAIVGVLYMAMPIGIIGQAFNDVWKDRNKILLLQRTRDRLGQWGYAATDIPVLFANFDVDKTGELDFSKFRDMLDTMNLGLSKARVVELFNIFDTDGGGSIDAGEFLTVLYPGEVADDHILAREDNTSPMSHLAARAPCASPALDEDLAAGSPGWGTPASSWSSGQASPGQGVAAAEADNRESTERS